MTYQNRDRRAGIRLTIERWGADQAENAATHPAPGLTPPATQSEISTLKSPRLPPPGHSYPTDPSYSSDPLDPARRPANNAFRIGPSEAFEEASRPATP
jgi:hypothetical protein